MKLFAKLSVLVVVLGGLVYGYFWWRSDVPETMVVEEVSSDPVRAVIGRSVQGRTIESFTFGSGDTSLLFVGGIHGGYEWNSVVLAYEFMKYLEETPEAIPDDIKIVVVPSANPDGVYEVVGKEGKLTLSDIPENAPSDGTGRFNANEVDLNRNFDCKWQPESTWRSKAVSAGEAAFSEPEAAAIRDVVVANEPVAVVFWHSQANAVYASECEEGILPETLALMRAYGEAAEYPTVDSFDAYEITGDAEGWLASIGIPAITVELQTHESVEWEKNKAGIEAIISHFSMAI